MNRKVLIAVALLFGWSAGPTFAAKAKTKPAHVAKAKKPKVTGRLIPRVPHPVVNRDDAPRNLKPIQKVRWYNQKRQHDSKRARSAR